MRLAELMGALEGATLVRGSAETEVSSVEIDSRLVSAGALFCCIAGAVDDGHRHIGEAVEGGAVALVTERDPDEVLDATVAEVRIPQGTTRRACAELSAAIEGRPGDDLVLVGVTGTNGKTTVVSILSSLLEAGGFDPGVIGTLTGARTTPAPPALHRQLAAFRHAAAERHRPGAVAMEVSSHALDQERVAGLRFAVCIFTNLSHDHLDYHGTLERYFEAKATLFEPARCRIALIWSESEAGHQLLARRPNASVAVGWGDARDLVVGPTGSTFTWRGQQVALGLIGTANVTNALLAAEAAVVLGMDPPVVATALSAVPPVRGRMERVDGVSPGPTVLVDYAHTPAALEGALEVCRQIAGEGRVLVVFGCGGDRDALKRPVMGAIAAAGASLAIVTTDNPRHEDPAVIAAAVIAGARGSATVLDIPDRTEAIQRAIAEARPHDVVLIAGKGHELTQEFATHMVAFDDRSVAAAALASEQGG